jgi:hypothetical protein
VGQFETILNDLIIYLANRLSVIGSLSTKDYAKALGDVGKVKIEEINLPRINLAYSSLCVLIRKAYLDALARREMDSGMQKLLPYLQNLKDIYFYEMKQIIYTRELDISWYQQIMTILDLYNFFDLMYKNINENSYNLINERELDINKKMVVAGFDDRMRYVILGIQKIPKQQLKYPDVFGEEVREIDMPKIDRNITETVPYASVPTEAKQTARVAVESSPFDKQQKAEVSIKMPASVRDLTDKEINALTEQEASYLLTNLIKEDPNFMSILRRGAYDDPELVKSLSKKEKVITYLIQKKKEIEEEAPAPAPAAAAVGPIEDDEPEEEEPEEDDDLFVDYDEEEIEKEKERERRRKEEEKRKKEEERRKKEEEEEEEEERYKKGMIGNIIRIVVENKKIPDKSNIRTTIEKEFQGVWKDRMKRYLEENWGKKGGIDEDFIARERKKIGRGKTGGNKKMNLSELSSIFFRK